MEVTRIGVDIAKNVFQVHGVDAQGKVVVRKQLERITSQCMGEPQGATQARAAATGIVLKACAIAPASA